MLAGPSQKKLKKNLHLNAWAFPEYELHGDMPSSVSLAGCRAKAMEKTRQRCLNPACQLRPPPVDGHSSQKVTQDLQPDDLEVPGVDLNGEEEEAPEEGATFAAVPAEDLLVMPDPSIVRDLWPFAFSMAQYVRVINAFPSKGSVGHVICLSRSAHPGALLACHSLGKQCHFLAEKQSAHSLAHGKDLLYQILYAENYQMAKSKIDPSKKRVLNASLPDSSPGLFRAHCSLTP